MTTQQITTRAPLRRGPLIAVGAAAALGIGVLVASVIASDSQDVIGAPAFVDEAGSAGIDHTYDGDFKFFVGGGVAVFDCSADGVPDLYIAGGSNPARLYRNESPVGGELQFVAVGSPITDQTGVVGAYPLDVDSDGHTDLAVLRQGENVLLRGRGDCQFERANELWGIDGGAGWTTAFSAKWEADAGLPTMAFGNYQALDSEGRRDEGCAANDLVRPTGATYDRSQTLAPGWCALSMLFSDWNRSGDLDLRISNDRQYYRDGEEQLWHVDAGAAPQLYGRDDGWEQLQIFGMGIASHDITGDGLPELYLTSMGDNKLQTLADGSEQPTYDDIALISGVTAHRPFTGDNVLPSTAWHAEFQDVNNDSFVDLFVAKGNVDAMVEFAAEDPNNLFLGAADGTFAEAAADAGLLSTARTRGAAVVDLNLDGLLDIVEVNRRDNVKLWRNVGSGDLTEPAALGNWLALRIAQDERNVWGIGSWVEVKVGDRVLGKEAVVGGGHAGGQLGWLHFGLGTADRAEVRVTWPDGTASAWIGVGANRFAIIERNAAQARVWEPAAS